jgi:hypothetical protein
MNHSPFEKLIKKTGQEINLSPAEREKMRTLLREYMAFKPMLQKESRTRPWFDGVAVALHTLLVRPAASLAAAVLILALTSGGVAFAAEGTLPGDVLYPIKVSVLEPAQSTLAVSAEAKANWNRTLAERRLDEATTLAAQGRLSTTTEAILIANFEYRADAAASTSKNANLKTDENNVSSAGFAARLTAYENILATIDTTKPHRATSRALQKAIHKQIDKEASTTVQTENEEDAGHLKTAASAALHASKNLLGSAEKTLTASTSVRARSALKDAENFNAKGEDLLKQKDARGASKAFKESLRATARLEVFTHAAKDLNVDAFTATGTTSTSTASTTKTKDLLPGPKGAEAD